MKHEWEHVYQGPEGLGNYGKRRCARCGAEQTKYSQHVWGRVTGYRWEPLVGRCKPPANRLPRLSDSIRPAASATDE